MSVCVRSSWLWRLPSHLAPAFPGSNTRHRLPGLLMLLLQRTVDPHCCSLSFCACLTSSPPPPAPRLPAVGAGVPGAAGTGGRRGQGACVRVGRAVGGQGWAGRSAGTDMIVMLAWSCVARVSPNADPASRHSGPSPSVAKTTQRYTSPPPHHHRFSLGWYRYLLRRSTGRVLLPCRCKLFAICWVLGISCTLRDFTNLPYHCPIAHLQPLPPTLPPQAPLYLMPLSGRHVHGPEVHTTTCVVKLLTGYT